MNQLPPSLDPKWKQYEESRLTLLASLSPLTAEQLSTPPPTGGWCILEVIEHLSRVDSLILKGIKQANEATRTARITDWIKYQLLVLAMVLPLKFPSPRNVTPREIPNSLADVAERWAQSRVLWNEYLRAQPEASFKQVVFSHPRAGGLTLPQTLRWLQAHQQRHIRQITRILT
ncbi:MAG: DinB family protein [Bacteroidia bacterium]|nr:DinB family protein [Bacteroidia bacterium]